MTRTPSSDALEAATLGDRPLSDENRREWTRHYARVRPDASRASVSVLVFRIGAEWLTLPTTILREVGEPRPVHVLPRRRSGAAVGLVNVRGDLTVHVSLAELLDIDREGIPASAAHAAMPRLLVVGDETRRLAFDVSEVDAVCRYDPSALRTLPSTLARARVPYTVGIVALGAKTVGCLDAARILDALAELLA